MLSTKLCQVFNIVHRLYKQPLSHLFEERIDIKLRFKYTLLATIVEWTATLHIFASDLVILSGKLSSILDILTLDNMLNEYFLLILAKLLLLLPD